MDARTSAPHRSWLQRTLRRRLRRLLDTKPEATRGVAFWDASYNPDQRTRKHRMHGSSLLLADGKLKPEALHLLLVEPLSPKGEREKKTAEQLACGMPVFVFTGSARQVFERFLLLTRGRLLVSHNLGLDQSALRRMAQRVGVLTWRQPFPGLDTLRLEQRAGHRPNTLWAAYARLGEPAMPKSMVTDALKVFALARRHGRTLKELQRLARQQMEARLNRLLVEPDAASSLRDPVERLRASRAARRLRAAHPDWRSRRRVRSRRSVCR